MAVNILWWPPWRSNACLDSSGKPQVPFPPLVILNFIISCSFYFIISGGRGRLRLWLVSGSNVAPQSDLTFLCFVATIEGCSPLTNYSPEHNNKYDNILWLHRHLPPDEIAIKYIQVACKKVRWTLHLNLIHKFRLATTCKIIYEPLYWHSTRQILIMLQMS